MSWVAWKATVEVSAQVGMADTDVVCCCSMVDKQEMEANELQNACWAALVGVDAARTVAPMIQLADNSHFASAELAIVIADMIDSHWDNFRTAIGMGMKE